MKSTKRNANLVLLILTLTINSFSDHSFHNLVRCTTKSGGKASGTYYASITCDNTFLVCYWKQNITENDSCCTTNKDGAVPKYVAGRAGTYGGALRTIDRTDVYINRDYDNRKSMKVLNSEYQTRTFTVVISLPVDIVYTELSHSHSADSLAPVRIRVDIFKRNIHRILRTAVMKCINISLLTSATSGRSLCHPPETDTNMLHGQSQNVLQESSHMNMTGQRTVSTEVSLNYTETLLTKPWNRTKTLLAIPTPHSTETFREPQHIIHTSSKTLSSYFTTSSDDTRHTLSPLHDEPIPALPRKPFMYMYCKNVLITKLTLFWMFILLLKIYVGGFSGEKYYIMDSLHSMLTFLFLNYDRMKHWAMSNREDINLSFPLRFHKKSVWTSYKDELLHIILPPNTRTKQTTDICLDVPAGYRWCSDTMCDKCQKLVSRNGDRPNLVYHHVTGCLSKRAGQWEVEARPLRRFLPDTTSNPDLDLAHLGYRLATLSALPPAVPVSRVKLADAGFYYRGQGDEVTCYACRGRHSGWTNDDKPWDVHRRISPNCPHVLEAPGGSGGSTATIGGNVPPVSAPRQDPQSAPPRGSMQATPQEVAGQSSQLVTSQGSSEEAAPSPTSPRIPNAVANNPRHMINRHSEAQFEDENLCNPTSLNTTTLTPALARRKAGTVAGQEQVEPSPLSGAQETMPPVYSRSQVFTSSVQSSATNNPHIAIQSGPGRTEAANTPAGTSRTDSSGGSNVPGAEVGSRNVSATTSAESSNRSQAVPGDNTPGVGSGGGPGGRPNVATAGTASAVPGGGANNAPGGGASARFMFPRAGLELGGAVYPMYQDMASRRRSFPRWDETNAPPLDQIILCGMFYAGYADCVRCFYCGVGLKHWELTDDVWTEHVRWRPSCGYLRAVKGDDFIGRIQARLAREASGDDDNDDGPGDGNDRPPGPSGPPRPQGRPGTTSQDREFRGDSRSLVPGPSALTRPASSGQHGDAQPSDTTVPAAPSPQSSATSGIPSLSTTVTAGTTVTAPSTVPALSSAPPTSATAAASPPESSNNQPSTRPEGGSSISVVEGETHSQRVARLQAENAELARRLRCKVCHREPIDTIIMPCGHLVVCENCARNTTQCPLCHGRIRATARVHMS